MGDTRFEERLKRIEDRCASGAKSELLAGVSEVRAGHAVPRKAVHRSGGRPVRSASFLLILLGALTGLVSFDMLHDLVDVPRFAALPPEEMLDVFRADPMVAAGASTLALCTLLAVTSFLLGRRSVRVMSFSGAALGSALGAAMPLMT